MDQSTIALPPSAETGTKATFTGERRSFFGLIVRGALLEMVTLGFYRFWLTTDMRRHFWSNTSVDGDSAEYTGQGKELLIGFLIATAIFVPLYLGYFLLGLAAEVLQVFSSIPLVVLLYVFTQFAIYRARRYRMTRTMWRGVRFWMSGSGWSYALRASLWGLLTVLSLGLALPWRDAALERYKMKNTHYGDLQGRFEGNGWDFFKKAWWLWVLTPVVVYVFIAAPFVYAGFRAIQLRWWLDGIRLGNVRFESNLRKGALIGLYWKVIGWLVALSFVLAAYLVFAAAVSASFDGISVRDAMENPAQTLASIPFITLAAIGYLAYVMTLNVVIRLYLVRDFWERAVSSLTIYNLDGAANVAVKGELANAIGEGFADGLDVGGF